MEREPLSKETQTRDALLISLSGGAIGIIGAIAEGNILFAGNVNTDAAILMGGTTLVGFALAVRGVRRFIELIKSSKENRE